MKIILFLNHNTLFRGLNYSGARVAPQLNKMVVTHQAEKAFIKKWQFIFTLTNVILPAIRKFTICSISIQSPNVNLGGWAIPQPNKRPETREKLHIAGRPVHIA